MPVYFFLALLSSLFFVSCKEKPSKNIGLKSGGACGNVEHGGSVIRIRYQIDSSGICRSEEQRAVCDQGVLSRFTGTYTLESCGSRTLYPSSQSCEWEGEEIKNRSEAKRLRYREGVVADLSQCEPETQYAICRDGVISSWSGTYRSETCRTSDGRVYNGEGQGLSLSSFVFNRSSGLIQLASNPRYCLHKEGYGSGNGAAVGLYECRNGDRKNTWKFLDDGRIQSQDNDEYCLHVKGQSSITDGQEIHLWECRVTNSNSKWRLQTSGQIELAAQTGLCLGATPTTTSTGSSLGNGDKVVLTDDCQ